VQLTVLTASASDWGLNLATCGAEPVAACQPALTAKGKIVLKRGTTAVKDAFTWRWTSSIDTPPSDFGDPTALTAYTLCAYDGIGLLLNAVVQPAGTCADAPCWATSGDGFKYRDRNLGTGVNRIRLKPGIAGKAKIVVKAKGANLGGLRSFPASPPVTVQLRAANEKCWQATVAGPTSSDGKKFRGKSL
jgi:hypothetical protein